MADFNHNSWPDIPQSHFEKPAIIKTAESLWIWTQTWKVVIDTKNWVATILIRGETKKETQELSESFKKEFIEKLKKLPDYKWSKVEEAIEKWTIEIKKIPNRNGYAIYESKIWNLVYITYLDGRSYINVDKYRYMEMLSDFFLWWYIRIQYWKIELDKKTWLWILYKKDWKEVPIFSDEYTTATLNATNEMFDFIDWIREEAKKRWIKEKD
jgi:hypothetical protein